MTNDRNQYNQYQINNRYQTNQQYSNNEWEINNNSNKKLRKERVAIMLFLLIIAIALCFIVVQVIGVIQDNMKQQQYEKKIMQAEQEKKNKEEQVAKEEAQKLEAKRIAEEAERQKKIPKLTDEGRKNLEDIYHSETKRAFLTFDDGPSTVTTTILEVLKQENVPATFFVLGSRVEAMPDMVKRIYEEGHYIANHGYSHQYSSIYANPQNVLDEFNRCNEAVKNAIGVPEYNSHLFRFPGGFPGGPYVEVKTQAKELLSQNDILHIDWNALSGDAETNKPTVEYEMNRIQTTTANRNSVVILLHDAQAKKATAEALPQIISYLREQGYEFKNFYDIIK